MEKTELTHNDYVKMSVDSGVSPLELRFVPIVSCETGFPVAYKTKTQINSNIMGTLTEEDYTNITDRMDCGTELLKHSLQHVLTAVAKFEEKFRNVSFFTVRCPVGIADNQRLYDTLSAVLKKNPLIKPEKICLEFPPELLEKDVETAKKCLNDAKLLKVRTLIGECGKEGFPLTRLIDITPDVVILDKEATKWAGDRNKPRLLTSMIAYLGSMGISVLATGNEKQRKAMRTTDCIGFIYDDEKTLSLEEALAQKEEE